jgi:hypothetical protein
MRCNKRIALNANASAETYCMREDLETNPVTGVLEHPGPCEARCCGRILRKYDPNAKKEEISADDNQ